MNTPSLLKTIMNLSHDGPDCLKMRFIGFSRGALRSHRKIALHDVLFFPLNIMQSAKEAQNKSYDADMT